MLKFPFRCKLSLPALVFVVAGSSWISCLTADEAAKKNWHQFRGPLATGEAIEGDPPVTWSETENVRWKTAIPGSGSATPIVWGDRIFILTAEPAGRVEQRRAAEPQTDRARRPDRGDSVIPRDEQADRDRARQDDDASSIRRQPPPSPDREDPSRGEARRRPGGDGPQDPRQRRGGGPPTASGPVKFMVLCIDRNSGEILWNQTAIETVPHEGHHQDHGFASGSPITDGKYLYVTFGSRGYYCFDFDGNLKWSRDLGVMSTRNSFGEGTSLALANGKLIVGRDHEGNSHLEVLDASNGETVWRVDRNEPTTWATPIVVEQNGRSVVIANGTNRVRAYDLENGDLVWECGGLGPNAIPSPVTDGEYVYCMTGFRSFAALAIPLSAQGDITESNDVRWSLARGTPYVPSPLLYQGRLYFFQANTSMLTVLDVVTGEPIIDRERITALGNVYASPVAVAGRVYFTGRDGTFVVARANDELEILATNELDDRFDASPAIVGNQLILRGAKNLYCIEKR